MKSKALDRLIEYAQRRYGTSWNGHGVDDLVRKAYALGRKESGNYAGAKAVKVEVVQCPTSTSKR